MGKEWAAVVATILVILGVFQLHASNQHLHTTLAELKMETHSIKEDNRRLMDNVNEILLLTRRSGRPSNDAKEPAYGTEPFRGRQASRELLSSDEPRFGRSTIVSAAMVETPLLCAASVEAWALSINGTNLVNYLNVEFGTVVRMLDLLVGSISKAPTTVPVPVPTPSPTTVPVPAPTPSPIASPAQPTRGDVVTTSMAISSYNSATAGNVCWAGCYTGTAGPTGYSLHHQRYESVGGGYGMHCGHQGSFPQVVGVDLTSTYPDGYALNSVTWNGEVSFLYFCLFSWCLIECV